MTTTPENSDVFRIRLSRDGIVALPPAERAFLFASAHLANELNMLRKWALFSLGGTLDANLTTKEGQMAQTMFALRLLAGKLNEGHQLLHSAYYGPHVSRTYHPLLDQESKNALLAIKRYFRSGENLVTKIRNGFAFHYSPQEIGAAVDRLSPDESLDCYLSTARVNVLFYYAEVLAVTAMLGEVAEGTVRPLLRELLALSKEFMTFAYGYFQALLRQHSQLLAAELGPADLRDAPVFEDVRLPFFTTNPDLS